MFGYDEDGRVTKILNVALVAVKTAQITGTAVNSKGQPMAGGFISAMERNSAIGNGNGAPILPENCG